MKKHFLKTWPSFFEEVAAGRKTFEVRKNDRDYQVGDELVLQEYTPYAENKLLQYLSHGTPGCYTGREITVKVTFMLEAENGLIIGRGYCVMAIKPILPD